MAELSDEIGARVAGLSSQTRAGDRILQRFSDLGYTPDAQDFTFTRVARLHHSRNIIAIKPGTEQHGHPHRRPLRLGQRGRGAFDNASGVVHRWSCPTPSATK